MAKNYRFLDHTADMGIEAEGSSLEELFVNAANGLREMIFGPLTAPSESTDLNIVLEGIDREELLVSWLNEILFFFETRRFVPLSFKVLAVGSREMSAIISGFYFKDRLSVEREVKAVTYHRVKLENAKGNWKARLFVDL